MPVFSFLLHRSIVMSTEMERREKDCTISRKNQNFSFNTVITLQSILPFELWQVPYKITTTKAKKVLKRNLLKA